MAGWSENDGGGKGSGGRTSAQARRKSEGDDIYRWARDNGASKAEAEELRRNYLRGTGRY